MSQAGRKRSLSQFCIKSLGHMINKRPCGAVVVFIRTVAMYGKSQIFGHGLVNVHRVYGGLFQKLRKLQQIVVVVQLCPVGKSLCPCKNACYRICASLVSLQHNSYMHTWCLRHSTTYLDVFSVVASDSSMSCLRLAYFAGGVKQYGGHQPKGPKSCNKMRKGVN